mgnify:CR=1 FL=1
MGTGYRISAKGKEVEIFLYEDIGEGFFGGVSAKGFASDLKAAGKVETINLRINSYGGDVFDGLAIYNLLAAHDARVVSHIDGIAASIASVIAMAGNEIRIAENGFLMIHDAWGAASGNASDIHAFANTLEMVSGSIADVYAKRTGKDRAGIVDMMHAETWMDAKEATEKGFATSMVENVQMAAKYDPAKHKFAKVPDVLKSEQRFTATVVKDSPRPNFASRLAEHQQLSARYLLRNSRPG